MITRKKILVTVMNWGLGHASRCIPIIRELERQNFLPLIASDGQALLLLQKEFPHVRSFELPSYNISYSERGAFLKWKLFLQTPGILRTIKAEQKETEQIIAEENIGGIISDNRFGTHSELVPSVYITHQLRVLSGFTTPLSSRIHQAYIEKFDQCWIPDAAGEPNLSGLLGHPKKAPANLRYIGPISRFEKEDLAPQYDYLVLLSGPEPQRTLLQNLLLHALRKTERKVLFVRGVIEERPSVFRNPNILIRNYLFGKELERAINSSRVVISRSGFSSLLDLAKLQKQAFFIPTPGQYEQQYLAQRLHKMGIAPYCQQWDFSLPLLEEVDKYSGLINLTSVDSLGGLFTLFERE